MCLDDGDVQEPCDYLVTVNSTIFLLHANPECQAPSVVAMFQLYKQVFGMT